MGTLSRRQTEIMALAREAGRVAVDDLAERFTVTPQTIRRDLNELSDHRLLTRVHGGAMSRRARRTWPTRRAGWWRSRTSG